jgi:hypothetical protein
MRWHLYSKKTKAFQRDINRLRVPRFHHAELNSQSIRGRLVEFRPASLQHFRNQLLSGFKVSGQKLALGSLQPQA